MHHMMNMMPNTVAACPSVRHDADDDDDDRNPKVGPKP